MGMHCMKYRLEPQSKKISIQPKEILEITASFNGASFSNVKIHCSLSFLLNKKSSEVEETFNLPAGATSLA